MRKLITTICENCNKQFEKHESEIKRNLNIGRKNYCSRTCSGKHNIKNFGNKIYDIRKIPRGIIRIPTFTCYYRAAKRRNKIMDLDIPYLRELWDKQEGKCAYSQVKLTHPSYKKSNDTRFTASLDRIDSSKGYVKGNVQFISIAINYMKGQMSDENIKEFIKIICNNMIESK